MNSQTAQTTTADELAIRDFHRQMIDAWNRGSGEGFAAPFSETADFITFEGTHLKGRKEIAAFHQQAFDTVVKGTRLEGEVNFVRLVNSQTRAHARRDRGNTARTNRNFTVARFATAIRRNETRRRLADRRVAQYPEVNARTSILLRRL